jgi:hypothetical protein
MKKKLFSVNVFVPTLTLELVVFFILFHKSPSH